MVLVVKMIRAVTKRHTSNKGIEFKETKLVYSSANNDSDNDIDIYSESGSETDYADGNDGNSSDEVDQITNRLGKLFID